MRCQADLVITEMKGFIDQGRSVILPVDGWSMRPFIIGGKDKVEFVPLPPALQLGDVVMAKVQEGYHVVHRVVEIDGDHFVLEGDGNLGFQEHCLLGDIVAQGIYVIDRKGRKQSLISPSARRRWKVWMRLKPLRRILLKIFKIFRR